MKLYIIPSACSLAAHILVREAGLDIELIKVDLATKKLSDGTRYSAIVPKGQVSALHLENGDLLTENIAVLAYLASLAPERNLMAQPGSPGSFRVLEWLTFVATELHKQIFWTTFNAEAPSTYKTYVRRLLPKRFETLSGRLEEQNFIATDSFTAADAYLTWALHLANLLGESTAPWPALRAYQERMFARPSVVAALAFEAAA